MFSAGYWKIKKKTKQTKKSNKVTFSTLFTVKKYIYKLALVCRVKFLYTDCVITLNGPYSWKTADVTLKRLFME